MRRIAAAALLLAAAAARADEGMWPFDSAPVKQIAARYGFTPSPDWLARARLGSVRFTGGCSGSFVSKDGLVMTNHHCAAQCLQAAGKNFETEGFFAPKLESEQRCTTIELNQLLEITDVTGRIAGGERPALVERECAGADETLRCDVVKLHGGARLSLYKYRRFTDVRLVFAPEAAIAFFGGDADNFTFPRYDLDVAFLRAWQDGKPAQT